MMIARAPTLVLCDLSLWTMGITKAAVFPDPVRAMACYMRVLSEILMLKYKGEKSELTTTSCPSRRIGIVFRCIGVGTEKPFY